MGVRERGSLLYLMVNVLVRCVAEEGEYITVGLLLPWTGSRPVGTTIASAASIAVFDINNNASILPGKTLRFVWKDTKCLEKKGLYEIVQLWAHTDQNKIHGFVGPGCDEVCEPSGLLASAWNIPMVSWGCTSTHLDDKTAFSTFARVVGPFSKAAPLFVKVMDHWNWQRVGILASANIAWQITAETIKVVMEEHGKEVGFFHSFESGHQHMTKLQADRHIDMLERAKETVRSKCSKHF